MEPDFDAHYQLMQSLQAAFPEQSSQISCAEQLEDLEQARQQLLTLISGSQITEQQQRAMELLRRRTSMDYLYGRRLQQAEQRTKNASTSQRQEIYQLYQHALQRVSEEWPELGRQECETMPRLLLLQKFEDEIHTLFDKMTGRRVRRIS